MEIFQAECGTGIEKIEGMIAECGTDLSITLCGGTKPHVGAVSMACYEPKRHSATVSTITAYGHRDDVLAASCAKQAATMLECTAVVNVGIHVDDADAEMIDRLSENCRSCFEALLEQVQIHTLSSRENMA